jgi:hypothetical protein
MGRGGLVVRDRGGVLSAAPRQCGCSRPTAVAAPAIAKLFAFRRWSCSTPATCGESFFLIGQMIQFTRELLELRFRLRTACRVGYRTHARGIDAAFLDQVRCLVSVTHRLVSFALQSLAWRTTCRPLASGYRARSSERVRFFGRISG